jgi:hypothetical protein
MSWLQYLTRSNPRRKTVLAIVLEAIPILFHIFLVVFLTYFLVVHNYDTPVIVFVVVFVDTQILMNWLQFLRHKAFVTPTIGNFPGYVNRFSSLASGTFRGLGNVSAICKRLALLPYFRCTQSHREFTGVRANAQGVERV